MVKIIAHPETGKLFTETSNPEWVKCQVQSKQLTVNNGVINVQTRTAFPLVKTEAIELMDNLKSGDNFPINGKIIRKLTSEPQFVGHKAVVNPSTGEEMSYYQSFTFVEDLNTTDIDERVKSTVSESIKTPEKVSEPFSEE